MVKGVNKQIIEISDTGNQSFERAILFVRPDSQRLDSETLHCNAADFLAKPSIRKGFFKHRRLWSAVFGFLVGVALGFVAATVVFCFYW